MRSEPQHTPTMLLLTVAPATAKLYVRISDLLYMVITASIQFGPPVAVTPCLRSVSERCILK
jgi:hypothetical protein